MTTAPLPDAQALAGKLRAARDRILTQAEQVVIGQRGVLEQLLTALFADGHCLLVGAPGLAKTLMVKVLAGTLELNCRRVQFTPDLMPADLVGTDILEEDPATRQRSFRFQPGPVFTNILLADEINRTPPKTQAALLEAMGERRVTAGGETRDLPKPYFVLATQNPIEQEGTYPLPEAQLDRFMFCIRLDYPSAEDEQRILVETTANQEWKVERVLAAKTILDFQRLVRQVPISPHVARYATELIRATRPGPDADPWVRTHVRWGAGTRAGRIFKMESEITISLASIHDAPAIATLNRLFNEVDETPEAIAVR
ncbi:MAG: AAA family ATPase, partial [Planctomycetes bacterium]|nr:AAA family ATPase [Planctomycetota bacterium]